jgi:ABC-type transport system substrate-binding protein
MKNSILLQQVIAISLVMLILVGCGTPAAPPVSEAPAATSTPKVSTATPEPPTATPAPAETPEPPLATSVDDLIGRWSFGSGAYAQYFHFNEDGTYVMARGSVANLEDNQLQFGPFLFEDGLLTFETSDDSLGCTGQSGTYEVRLLEEGRIAFVLVEDECSLRAGEHYSSLVPLSP